MNTLDCLSGSWIMEVFPFLAYVGGGLFYFLHSLTLILAFQVGFLHLPSAVGASVGASATIALVMALSSEQLEDHNKGIDFLPGQQTAIVDNCTNAHIWNKRHQFVSFRPLSAKE